MAKRTTRPRNMRPIKSMANQRKRMRVWLAENSGEGTTVYATDEAGVQVIDEGETQVTDEGH
jgi:hypothetical protein